MSNGWLLHGGLGHGLDDLLHGSLAGIAVEKEATVASGKRIGDALFEEQDLWIATAKIADDSHVEVFDRVHKGG